MERRIQGEREGEEGRRVRYLNSTLVDDGRRPRVRNESILRLDERNKEKQT